MDHKLTVRETSTAYDPRPSRPSSIPALLLKGKWLAGAGFTPGQKVKVVVEQGKLTISPVTNS